ncbi:MAG: hypothetical protein M1834_000246 [Cirrosporium novae-zelandiae]|nr:MAG: hypothetical protein M1834_000246 [Cirrosporium novae-zelandiae]
MGKRKKSTRKPQGPKKREKLETTFPCLFCNHEKSVSVSMAKKDGIGNLSYLSHEVDVYSDWIDACDAVAKEAAEEQKRSGGGVRRGHHEGYGGTSGGEDDRGDYDDIVDDDEELEAL